MSGSDNDSIREVFEAIRDDNYSSVEFEEWLHHRSFPEWWDAEHAKFGTKYRNHNTSTPYTYTGLYTDGDDYYYVLTSWAGLNEFLTCVGSIEDQGFTKVDD